MYLLKQLIISGLVFIFFSCHNNAHLRTQKFLKNKESVISVSGVLPIGGINDRYAFDDENGIIGMRGELSYLKGFGNYELGPYAGFGVSDFDDPGFIMGFDYKKYLNIYSNNPLKFGAQFELNLSDYGSVFHIKPSLVTATNERKSGYLGIHGILYNGTLEDWEGFESFKYSSLGIGLTIGSEYIFSKLSIQAQADLSMVNNKFHMDNISRPYSYYGYDDDWFADPGDDYYLLAGLSAGLSFFNAPKTGNESFEPMPTPSYQNVKPEPVVYDPNTGASLSSGSMQFDPETGELLSSQVEKFDPSTGEKIIPTAKVIETTKDPLDQFVDSNKTLTDGEVVYLANTNGTEDYVSPVWTLAGFASLPMAFAGAIMGGTITFEVMDLDEIGFIGPIAGGLAGFTIPYVVSNNTDPNIIYPPNLRNNRQINLYKKTYSKKIKERRSKKISGPQAACVILPAGLLFMLLLGI